MLNSLLSRPLLQRRLQRADRTDVAAQPITEEEFVAREVCRIVALIEDERLCVDAGNQALTWREQFLQFASHEVGGQLREVLPVGIGDTPGDGVKGRAA